MKGRFGEILAEARKQRRITLRKLGNLVGLSPSFLSEMEKGRRLPPKDETKIQDLALILNLNQEKFLEEARNERKKKDPKLFEKLFAADQNLAWGFCRASENATDEEVQKALKKALEVLEGEGG